MIFTIVRAGGFVIVLPFVLKRLPTEEVGLWYVFTGIGGLCAALELGFSPVISRFASYYVAGLQELPGLKALKFKPADGQTNHEGLAGLVRMSTRLYNLIASVLFVVMVFGGGGWLLVKYHNAILRPFNLLAFVIFAAGNAWSMSGYFWTSLLFGINQVKAYQTTLIEGLLLNYAITLSGLYLHCGIVSLAAGQVTLAVYQRLRARNLFYKLYRVDLVNEVLPVRWRHLWPMTWRGGVTSFCSAFPLAGSTLVCAQLYDLNTTASYALSLQLVMMACTLANNWLAVKFPVISILQAQGKMGEVRKIVYERMILQTISYAVICTAAYILAPPLLHLLRTKTNFMASDLLALLMIVGGVDLFVNALCAVILTRNQFPLLKSMVFNTGLGIVLSFVLGRHFGLAGMICGPMLAQLVFNGWYTLFWCWKDLREPLRAVDVAE